ncbi:hypothetical protein A5725_06040 [Mycobacterium kubicae]|nr:hypothetical protein A5725_06040 [Mycobacterium kubicae]
MVPISPTLVAVAEQPTKESTLLVGRLRVLLGRYVLLGRRRRRLGGGIEPRFSLHEDFEFAAVKEDSAASGALIDLYPEPLHRQHL